MNPVLALALVVVGQVEIVGPATVEPFRLVELAAKGDVAGKALVWDVTPEENADVRELPGGKVVFVAPPGVYRVKLRAIAVKDGATTVDTARHSVTVSPLKTPPVLPPGKPPSGGAGVLDPMRARVRLSIESSPGRFSGCTGTVIYPRRDNGEWHILSANHCIPASNGAGTVTTVDGRKIKVTVKARDPEADVAWFETSGAPDDLAYAILSKELPAVGTEVWHAGYGVDKPGNTERGKVTGAERRDGKIEYAISVSSGDSGTGFFRADTAEVVGTLYGTEGWAGRTITVGGSCRRAWACRPK
jgi:hypothetical protein